MNAGEHGSNGADRCDVAIVGGGPAGSTAASLLKKYDPDLHVVIVEKEKFPRDHVGESQLPGVSAVLHEMGVWDAVEAAGFPVKIGASYTWGKSADRWDFDFYPVELWEDQPRPAQFAGQRRSTAFQVDRAIYDDLLLRHAASLGVEVREEVRVTNVPVVDDTIGGLELSTGSTLTARHYLDASGAAAILRRALGVEVEAPKALRNIAIWDYWENAEWAVEIGVGATRVQVRSLPFGWIWFIPLGPTRTSIGLICPAEHYRARGQSPEELYHEAIRAQPDVVKLITNATPRGMVETTKDWSHLADRLAGPNWLICGESAGFADPILAAGMMLAHGSARDAAYTILELERGEHDADWLRSRYDERNRGNIAQHIRFAQYWYSANGCFTDLQEHCSSIAREAGLRLNPQQAWRWLSQGGFAFQNPATPGAGSFDVATAKHLLELFDGGKKVERLFEGYNEFVLNLHNTEEGSLGHLADGRIQRVPCWRKGSETLPRIGVFEAMVEILGHTTDIERIFEIVRQQAARLGGPGEQDRILDQFFQALDVMIQQGWVQRKKKKGRPFLRVTTGEQGTRYIRTAEHTNKAMEDAGRSGMVRSKID